MSRVDTAPATMFSSKTSSELTQQQLEWRLGLSSAALRTALFRLVQSGYLRKSASRGHVHYWITQLGKEELQRQVPFSATYLIPWTKKWYLATVEAKTFLQAKKQGLYKHTRRLLVQAGFYPVLSEQYLRWFAPTQHEVQHLRDGEVGRAVQIVEVSTVFFGDLQYQYFQACNLEIKDKQYTKMSVQAHQLLEQLRKKKKLTIQQKKSIHSFLQKFLVILEDTPSLPSLLVPEWQGVRDCFGLFCTLMNEITRLETQSPTFVKK